VLWISWLLNNFGGRSPHFRGNINRNGLYAVNIPVKQIPGINFQSANFDRFAHFQDVNKGV